MILKGSIMVNYYRENLRDDFQMIVREESYSTQ